MSPIEWLVGPVQEFLARGIADFQRITGAELVLLFWFTFIFDIPRYLVPDIVIWFWDLVHGVNRRFGGERDDFDDVLEREPKVSIIIPSLNAGEHIENTIETVLETAWPNKEVIVVDDGSDDDTYEKAMQFSDDPRVRVFQKDYRGGKASALNMGFRASTGEFIISVDSDTAFERGSITKLLERFNDPDIGAVSGNLRVKNEDKNMCTLLQACEYLQTIAIGRIALTTGNLLMVVSGAFSAFRREILEKTLAWDPGIGDDSNMTLKARKVSPKIGFAPNAIAYTSVPESWVDLWVQRKRWDKNFLRNRLKKHRNLLDPTRFAASNLTGIAIETFYRIFLLIAFYSYLVYVFALFPTKLPLIVIGTFVIYGTANYAALTAAVSVAKQPDQYYLVLLAPVMLYYRLYLRAIRTVAFLEEFLRINYEDPFYPTEVWENIPRW